MNPTYTRPKITEKDISIGYITRYFLKPISFDKTIIEVDNVQFDKFKNVAWYQTLSFKWLITGISENITTNDGTVIYGTKHKNQVTINYYNTIMPGLVDVIRSPLEYFNGKQST